VYFNVEVMESNCPRREAVRWSAWLGVPFASE
jgi:hypothetical protein